VAAEYARGRELAELVADHLFRDEDGHVLAAVVDGDRVADHVGHDRRTTRPGLGDLLFAPLDAAAKGADQEAGDEEPAEPLIEGKVDLGAIATEFLLLGIDPYPRKAGAEFAAVKTADDSARPFAALEALKKRLGG